MLAVGSNCSRNLSATECPNIAIILALATLIRWPFVRKFAGYIRANPSIKIITTTFLILIGMTLILEGIQIEFPNKTFGLGLVAAIIVQMTYRKLREKKTPRANDNE